MVNASASLKCLVTQYSIGSLARLTAITKLLCLIALETVSLHVVLRIQQAQHKLWGFVSVLFAQWKLMLFGLSVLRWVDGLTMGRRRRTAFESFY